MEGGGGVGVVVGNSMVVAEHILRERKRKIEKEKKRGSHGNKNLL